jgi:N6-adenosine-specific RNA methylase IME4
MTYQIIYADPPWTYRDEANSGKRGVDFKYKTMDLANICRLPVWALAGESCLLAMWWVPTINRMNCTLLRVFRAGTSLTGIIPALNTPKISR